MKPFYTYLKNIKQVPSFSKGKYYAYKNGETKIFDNKEDAQKFSHLYEVVCSEDVATQREEIRQHNIKQHQLAVEQFRNDLHQEAGFNPHQIQVCRVFIENSMGESEYDRDVFAKCVLDISELLSDLNNVKD